MTDLLIRLDPVAAGRPDLMGGRTSLTLYEGAVGLPENAFINVKNKSKTITADVTVPGKASGVMLVQGGDFGGWTFYMKDGTPAYTYNWLGIEQFDVVAKQKVPAGSHTLKLEFIYDGGHGAGGTASIFLNDKKIGEGKIG